jgi:hypothetical protein
VLYCASPSTGAPEDGVEFVLATMAAIIVSGIVLEWILPQRLKDRLGAMICWAMMAVTMTFLGAATLGLIAVLWIYYLLPALTS